MRVLQQKTCPLTAGQPVYHHSTLWSFLDIYRCSEAHGPSSINTEMIHKSEERVPPLYLHKKCLASGKRQNWGGKTLFSRNRSEEGRLEMCLLRSSLPATLSSLPATLPVRRCNCSELLSYGFYLRHQCCYSQLPSFLPSFLFRLFIRLYHVTET